MSNYIKGRGLEYEIKKLFEDAGYAVMRGSSSKGTFDTPEGVVKPDLIATKATDQNTRTVQVILLQCKIKGKKTK